MSGCGTRIVLRGQKPLAVCDHCPGFGSLLDVYKRQVLILDHRERAVLEAEAL